MYIYIFILQYIGYLIYIYIFILQYIGYLIYSYYSTVGYLMLNPVYTSILAYQHLQVILCKIL